MVSAYPTGIDNFTDPTATDNLDTAGVLHDVVHTNVNDAINAIEVELGLSPSGASATVAARLDAIDVALAARSLAADEGAASGIATLDGGSKLVQELDAGKVTSGTFAVARIPNISGGKVLGTGSGGAAVPVDAVPNLPASKTTSGQFDAARIPNLDAAKITSGVFAAARIPVTVTANANSRTVADIASRDAIALVDRVDGMFVFVRNPEGLWIWRADNSTWRCAYHRVVAAAAISTTLDAGEANVTGFNFPCQSGVTYKIDCDLFIDNPGANAADIRFGFSFPGGTFHMAHMGLDVNVTAPAYNGDWTAHATMGDVASPISESTGLGLPLGIPVMAMVKGTYVCTTNGTVQLRFRQDAASGTASRVREGSVMEVKSV